MEFSDVLFGAAAASGGRAPAQTSSNSYQHPSFESYERQQRQVQDEAMLRAQEQMAAASLDPAQTRGPQPSAPLSTEPPHVAPPSVDGGPIVWGSFERNTGTWCPYPDSAKVEAAFARGDASIFLPESFNATIHFDRTGAPLVHHHQKTPAFGSKPPGFRSVMRATPGERALLYFHMDRGLGMWRLDLPSRTSQTQQVEIFAPAQDAATPTWQWCDLMGDALANAKEHNWHGYDAETSTALEAGWAAHSREVSIVIGITTYVVSDFNGSYAVQRNTTSGARRMVRRYVSGLPPPPPQQLSEAEMTALEGESCALCTELFSEHPEWPVRRTGCGHAFHHTCLNQLLQMDVSRRKCPLCRAPLERGGGSQGASRGMAPPPQQQDAVERMYSGISWDPRDGPMAQHLAHNMYHSRFRD